jgi:hypothetical protein
MEEDRGEEEEQEAGTEGTRDFRFEDVANVSHISGF